MVGQKPILNQITHKHKLLNKSSVNESLPTNAIRCWYTLKINLFSFLTHYFHALSSRLFLADRRLLK